MDGIIEQREAQLDRREELREKLKSDLAVKQLSSKLATKEQSTLMEFGKEAAGGISSFSDKILNSINAADVSNSSALIKQLDKLMDKFDNKELTDSSSGGMFDKFFNNGKAAINKIISKYTTMGSEIDKIHTEIATYEQNTKKSTQMLEQLYIENFGFYMELEKAIVAGVMVLEKWQQELNELNAKAEQGDNIAAMDASSLNLLVNMLEQRISDLETAQQVSFLQAPQIRMLQKNNNNLIAKINSAFVITLPLFKMGLISAIETKKEALIADSMDALDKRTNELIVKNAKNIAAQSLNTTRLAGRSSVKVETLEEAYGIISRGIAETQALEEENSRLRKEGIERIRQLQKNYDNLGILQ